MSISDMRGADEKEDTLRLDILKKIAYMGE